MKTWPKPLDEEVALGPEYGPLTYRNRVRVTMPTGVVVMPSHAIAELLISVVASGHGQFAGLVAIEHQDCEVVSNG